MDQVVPMITCPKCGQVKPTHNLAADKHICLECIRAENNRYSYIRNHVDIVAQAKDAELDLWVQQPGETQWEYTVWMTYRDSYPGKRPTYTDVAERLNTTLAAVRAVANRWSFNVRMQAWIKYCDDLTLQQRRDEVLEMNKAHIDMSKTLRDKLNVAIGCITPETLKPSEIATLAKLSTDLERKARMDTMAQEEVTRAMRVIEGENPDLKKSPTKQADLNEVVQILLKAGVLGQVAQVGVKQTTTTEVAIVDTKGNSSAMVLDEED